ncbi:MULTISPECIES: helix-turn-helix domain-containing protein [Pectobacterium]|uniref:helix-turn-helix domain-containing protein n=1 Tax=Pectobacterium TaxID=122277 RepID=UPI000DE6798E|nr:MULTISPECIES: helix-turn-helix transcriptional regulator [Pectobacterium]AZK61204.1 XRE family transcriptional regulator [Pectobacterium versatile]MBA0188670.1 helix-turn-helix transcriptional regulator [Pectobacterium odoriferum]MBI0471781.1 helix-turn-helix transcriptional regulator [Pectobacterium parmentieri]MBI0494466.1 helix-turn-helix transcriptional regulator [Pectobacterium parmentieri]MBI0568764.1 helix-turn-helix transcriptional regulator [Pectobacterium parmentieri]
MAVKGISFSEVKAKALSNHEVKKAYEDETQEEALRAVLIEMKSKSGLTSTEIAARMGVSQPAVSRLERNVSSASISTLQRYAAACGMQLKLSLG